jgi:hypothetical protein
MTWWLIGILWLLVSFLVAIIFGSVARYGSGDKDEL